MGMFTRKSEGRFRIRLVGGVDGWMSQRSSDLVQKKDKTLGVRLLYRFDSESNRGISSNYSMAVLEGIVDFERR